MALSARLATLLAVGLLLGGCDKGEGEPAPSIQEVICNDRRMTRPGVSFDTLVMGDPEGHPLLVLLSREEQSAGPSGRPRWEVRETATPGSHLLIIDGHRSGYGGTPVVKAWSSKGTDRQYVEVRLPVEWISRFTITLDPNGPRHLPEFSDQEIEDFWADKVRPLFPPGRSAAAK
jgi:hypothetical protein